MATAEGAANPTPTVRTSTCLQGQTGAHTCPMGAVRTPTLVRQALLVRVVVLAGLAASVAAVYVVVVLGGGAILGRTDTPHLGLSVLATAVVALAFGPAQSRWQAVAARWSGRPAAAPYEVLSRFSETVMGTPDEDVAGRMSRLVAQATDAQWAQVWLMVGGQLGLAARWPPGAGDESRPEPAEGLIDLTGPGRRCLPVRHAGRLLAVLRLQEQERNPLTPAEERLLVGLAVQAGLVLHIAVLRAELARRLAELTVRAAELKASRQRVIDTQDDERRRLERDIHDGAQQHLVALAVNLRLVQSIIDRDLDQAGRLLVTQRQAALEAIAVLSDLSRGIYPRRLREVGLLTALRTDLRAAPIPVEVVGDGIDQLPATVETALYFCCLEAIQNAAKHSGANRASVGVFVDPDDVLHLSIDDDGAGFDPDSAESGSGLANMLDRVDALGGLLQVSSSAGHGTHVEIRVPLRTVTPRQRVTPRQTGGSS